MLDQKSAWDSFIRRHARSPEIVDAIIGNDFYRQLFAHFAGATEYAAIEQVCWLHESGRFDLIVLDTPAAAHAFDFVRAGTDRTLARPDRRSLAACGRR